MHAVPLLNCSPLNIGYGFYFFDRFNPPLFSTYLVELREWGRRGDMVNFSVLITLELSAHGLWWLCAVVKRWLHNMSNNWNYWSWFWIPTAPKKSFGMHFTSCTWKKYIQNYIYIYLVTNPQYLCTCTAFILPLIIIQFVTLSLSSTWKGLFYAR